MKRLAVFATISLGLSFAALAQSAKNYFPEEDIPRFNIPKMAAAPKIDGVIEPDEWRSAMRIMGMATAHNNTFYNRPHTFWVAWDENHIYLAGRAHVLPGHILGKSRREKYTTQTVFDDAYEFGLSMEGRNQKPGEAGSFFKFILNFLGSGEYLKMYPSIGQYLYNWRPEMDIANRLYEKDDAQWWEIEVAMDLADLEMPASNKAGDPLRILLAHDGKNPGWVWTSVPSATGYLVHDGFPRAILTDTPPYVQIEEFGGLHDEKVILKSVIYNPSTAPVKVRARLQITNQGQVAKEPVTKVGVDENRVLEVPAGGSVRFDVDQGFPGFDYRNEGHPEYNQMQGAFDFQVTLVDQPEAPAVFHHHLVFRKDAEKKYLEYTPPAVAFNMATRYNPISHVIWVEADTLDARVPAGTKLARADWAVKQGDAVVAQGQIDRLVYAKYQDLIQLPELKPGTYDVVVSLVGENGQALLTRNATVEKKNEAKEFPDWWGKAVGNPEQLLKPFEPVRAKGNTITVTRRAYELDGLGLPVQISANDGPLLTGPARIVLVVAGQDYAVPARGSVKLTEKKDWRYSFEGIPTEVAGVKFSTKGKIEQDGLVSLELTYHSAKQPVRIQELRIEWPVDDTWGNHLACMGVGGNYSARFIGAVPAGHGVVWSTLRNIGQAGSGMTVGNFYQNLWVGTEKRGLFWWANSDEGWVPNDAIAAHDIVRERGTTIIRNHLIGTYPGAEPFELARPRTVKFSYNASPFRKLTPGWRINQTSYCDGFSGGKYKSNWDTGQDFFSILSPPFPDRKRWPEYYAWCKEEAAGWEQRALFDPSAFNRMVIGNGIATRGYMDKTVEPGLYGYFGADWQTSDSGESLNESYRDYMMYLQHRQVTEGGCRHFYYDISMCGRVSRELVAGFGYLLPDGRIQPSGTDATLREWYIRADALMQEFGQYPPGVSGHSTQTIPLLALPFCAAQLDSEFPMKDPITVYPSDRMIALSCPHSFGCNISHLGFMNPHWAAMHDSAAGGGGYPFSAPEFRHWGITRDDVEFIPYWRNNHVVRRIGDGLIASLWKRPGSAVLEIMNYGPDDEGFEKTRPCELTLDLRALGVPAEVLAQGGERLRIGELLRDREIPGRYLDHLKWYQDLPGEEDKYQKGLFHKFRPAIEPVLDRMSGALTGFDISYHDQRYLVISWDDQPINDAPWRNDLAAVRAAALDWGIVGAKPVGDAGLTKPQEEAYQVKAWTRPDSVLIMITNGGAERKTTSVGLDLAKLGVQVSEKQLWERYVQLYDLEAKPVTSLTPADVEKQQHQWQRGVACFDPWGSKLLLTLDPGESRYLCIDRN